MKISLGSLNDYACPRQSIFISKIAYMEGLKSFSIQIKLLDSVLHNSV